MSQEEEETAPYRGNTDSNAFFQSRSNFNQNPYNQGRGSTNGRYQQKQQYGNNYQKPHYQGSRNENKYNRKMSERSRNLEEQSESQKILSREERNQLPTKMLREFHNWIKAVMIVEYSTKTKESIMYHYIQKELGDEKEYKYLDNLFILEMGCGKGGDLTKWEMQGLSSWVGVDICSKSLKEAKRRIESIELKKGRRLGALLVEESCGAKKEDFFKNFGERKYFDIASLQFCAHYMFNSETSVRNMLNNMTQRLLKFGYVLLTIPDEREIINRFKTESVKEDGKYKCSNKYYKMQTEKFENFTDYYGNSYDFYLDDAVGEKQNEEGIKYKNDEKEKDGDTTLYKEYFINTENFIKIANRDYGLRVVENQNFLDYYEQKKIDFKYLFRFYHFKDIDEELREISKLYRVLIFQKMDGKQFYKNERKDYYYDVYKSQKSIKSYFK